ncbi:acyl-CoA dehydrogenase family protein [Paraconexibacter algicola]|uniref:Acyl-CoA dehydrogenase n=1 Tax=Paraconexibacter algicola TaxID=2133960 RepID=A0A2T4UBW1_9ACTN|nr:acyl-CoA dehydrogenase family protein [Paraconexibacter algicola]PTL54366.1 acyl-CoA dehydrogenase [Paraconexibacter algicola]
MDFSLSPELTALQERTAAFVRDVVLPLEDRDRAPGHGPDDALRAELQDAAKDAGLFVPHLGEELGGLGLDVRGQAVVFEEAGQSLLGPLALNCAAPDEGNMAMLEKIASPEQVERFLRPLAEGRTRSAFAMTEPPPGAGSDPSMLRTVAERVDGGWSISGEKWFITGGEGAAFAIVMARTGERGATMFLVPADTPGYEVLESVDTIDRISPGGHAHMRFTDVRVADDQVLGAPDEGFRYAQVRLAPARLTHCMRWLGLARRALDVAIDRANEREAFGSRLADLGLAQRLIADSLIDVETSRAIIQKTAWILDTGNGNPTMASSIAKVHVSEAVGRIVDNAVQLCGSDGILAHPLGRMVAEVRPFRIYDGSNETHRWSIARRAAKARRSAGER